MVIAALQEKRTMKYMKKENIPNHHTDKQQEPHRVAARMEGVVKNKGTKNQKKEPKSDK